jgi:glycosyltransferase involved in cell wall biosynthesis
MARNNGLRRSRGEYVSFLDPDDFFDVSFLEKMYETAVAQDLDIVVCDYDLYQSKTSKFRKNVIGEEQKLLKPGKVTSKNDFPDQIFQLTDGYVWSKLFRRSFLNEKQLAFPEQLRMFEDVYFVVTALSLAERLGKCAGILIHHRVYSEQARTRLFKKYYAQAPQMYADIKAFLMHNGMYLPLSVSYVNLTARRCFRIYNLLWADAKAEFYTMLHDEYAEKMGWSEIAPEDYTDPAVCRFAATVQMYTYEQAGRREAKGLKLSFASLKQWMERQRKNRRKEPGRLSRLFSSIFSKKKK